jgi:hypothetical protein
MAYPVAPKTSAAGVSAAVSGAVLYLLQTYVFKGSVPGGVASLIYVSVPGLLAFAAAYLAPHQPRPSVPGITLVGDPTDEQVAAIRAALANLAPGGRPLPDFPACGGREAIPPVCPSLPVEQAGGIPACPDSKRPAPASYQSGCWLAPGTRRTRRSRTLVRCRFLSAAFRPGVFPRSMWQRLHRPSASRSAVVRRRCPAAQWLRSCWL